MNHTVNYIPEEIEIWFNNTLSKIRYKEFTNLQNTIYTIHRKVGSCHDQAIYEIKTLRDMGYESYGHFLMEVDDEGQGYSTHSFAYFNYDNDWFWVENAWIDYCGIYKFDSEYSLIDYVTNQFKKSCHNAQILHGVVEPNHHHVGENLQDYVETCLDEC